MFQSVFLYLCSVDFSYRIYWTSVFYQYCTLLCGIFLCFLLFFPTRKNILRGVHPARCWKQLTEALYLWSEIEYPVFVSLIMFLEWSLGDFIIHRKWQDFILTLYSFLTYITGTGPWDRTIILHDWLEDSGEIRTMMTTEVNLADSSWLLRAAEMKRRLCCFWDWVGTDSDLGTGLRR